MRKRNDLFNFNSYSLNFEKYHWINVLFGFVFLFRQRFRLRIIHWSYFYLTVYADWYQTEHWAPRKDSRYHRSKRDTKLIKIVKVVVYLHSDCFSRLSCCDFRPSLSVRPSQLFSICYPCLLLFEFVLLVLIPLRFVWTFPTRDWTYDVYMRKSLNEIFIQLGYCL